MTNILDTQFIKKFLRSHDFECCDLHRFWEKAFDNYLLEVYICNNQLIVTYLYRNSTYDLVETNELTNEAAYFYIDKLMNPLYSLT